MTRRSERRRRICVAALAALAAPALAAAVLSAAASASAKAPPLVAPLLLPGSPSDPALPSGAVTVSPEPGSRTADPKTEISFLGRPAAELGTITVTGSKSGRHRGKLLAYSTGTGASFLPATPFVPGERVTVRTDLPIAGARSGTFSFTVATVVTVDTMIGYARQQTSVPGVEHFLSAPSLDPPVITVTTPNRTTGGGDFLLAEKGPVGRAGPMIVSPSGSLIWFDPVQGKDEPFDLNEQRYLGKPVLTYFLGRVVHGHGVGEDVLLNEHYRTVAVVKGGNGVAADLHEFQLAADGTALLTSYRAVRWNLTSRGGPADGIVFDGVVLEVDVRTGLVMEEWDSLDHVPVADSYYPAPKTPDSPYDYFHINSIEALAGGDLLVSGRNTSAAYEVDPADDGSIVFTLGGKHSSVTLGSGARFWFQHDVELHPGDVVTIFDDGAAPTREPASRALVEHVDPTTRQATVTAAYDNGTLATALGNVQLLGDGDLVVGWGTAPGFSELSPSGAVLFDAHLPAGDDSYRAYRDPWTGTPTTRPALAVEPVKGGFEVAMSWNGATGVASWRILSGSAATATPLTTVASSGFETTAVLAHLGAHVEAEALAADGAVLGRSAVVRS